MYQRMKFKALQIQLAKAKEHESNFMQNMSNNEIEDQVLTNINELQASRHKQEQDMRKMQVTLEEVQKSVKLLLERHYDTSIF